MTSRRAEYSRYHPNHGPALAPPSPTPTWTPAYLGVLVMVVANKKNFKPTVTAIMERYYAKYRLSVVKCTLSRSCYRQGGTGY